MTRREATLILQLPRKVTIKDIKVRHRRMMILNHPDHGGSTFLATKINEAKELLMKTAN